MALFKISKGKSNKLPVTYKEGHCYFTTDDGKFYVDTTDTAAGRVALNALYSDANRVQELSSGADLNGIIEPGYYGVFASATAQSLLNNPLSATATGIMLRVYKIGTSYYQEVSGTLEGGTYIRRYSSSWSAWRQLALVTDNVASATKLKTARTVRVNLASTSTASFNGTANITPGVNGILGIANGGTGNTTGTAAQVTNSFILKVNSGTTEGTSLYTFNGSAAKTLDIIAGTNVTLTAEAGKLTIASANTTYSANNGISLSGTTFSNSGVRSIATGTANGTISVNTNGTAADVAVKGLGSLAYSSATYAGGTAVTLNGASKAGSTASFFAPTTAGTSGQFLKSNGSGAPTWTSISVAGLTHIGTSQPTSSDYVLWVDTDEDAGTAMRSDAIKYKTFSIATSAWSGTGPYTYTMTATGVTANSAILNLTLDATS